MTAGIPIKNKLLMPDPDEFAAAVLAAADKGISISGCWQHAVQVDSERKTECKALIYSLFCLALKNYWFMKIRYKNCYFFVKH